MLPDERYRFRVNVEARRAHLRTLDEVRADVPRVVLPAIDLAPDDPRVPASARKLHALAGGRVTYAVAFVGRTVSTSGEKTCVTVAVRFRGGYFTWRDGRPWSGAVRRDGLPRKVGYQQLVKIITDRVTA